MPGNSQRKGAIRKTPKGTAASGSGGQRRSSREGRGPTPPREMRTGHKKGRAVAAAKRAAKSDETRTGSGAQGSRRASTGTASSRARGAGVREASEWVTGRNPVVEALRAGVPARTLYVATKIDVDDRVREAQKVAGDGGIPLLEVPRPELDRMVGGAPHQGIALQVPPYEYAHPDDLLAERSPWGPPLLVALDGVTDPRNLGAVLRSAAAFGATGVVVPERRAAGVTAAAWKASAGAASRVRVARATNLARALAAYKEAGLFVVGLAAGGSLDVAELTVSTEPLVLVVGSEGKGLSRLVQETCDQVVRIPIAATTESLNASVAASLALYEVAKARGA